MQKIRGLNEFGVGWFGSALRGLPWFVGSEIHAECFTWNIRQLPCKKSLIVLYINDINFVIQELVPP
jgi:hypothetical protein